MPTNMEQSLANFVWSDEKFSRSTNIALDNNKPESVPDYRFTSKSLRLLDDLLDSIQGIRRDRAWSIIGPYGSGKSTFLLFLLQLFERASSPWLQRCLIQLRLANPDLEHRLNSVMRKENARYLPVIVQGSRAPLDLSLCQALKKTATNGAIDTTWVQPNFLSSLDVTIQTMETGITNSRATIDLYEQAAKLAEIAGYKGLLVTIDEFGKFLERARWQGDLPDLASVQYLAELASSSDSPQILFLIALHQGFQQYASSLSKQQWLEWIKIQGRFTQIDFNEVPENLYGLVAAAINFHDRSEDLQKSLENWVMHVWTQVKGLPPFENEDQSNFWPDLLTRVYPFHPLTLYALPRLSSNLGQNERTLFTFLASDDPLGLKSFLKKTQRDSVRLPSLTLDYLYDYFVNGSRITLLPLEVQRKISEIEEALERLGDRPPEETRVLKAIGVLGLLKTGSSLPASKEVLQASLDINVSSNENIIQDILTNLISRKIIVYRQFAEEYRIWEGSDFDFDEALTKAREDVEPNFDLTKMLEDLVIFRPIFARRHSFETGTNRIFRVKLIAATDFLKMSNPDLSEMTTEYQSDGIILYVIPRTLQEINKARQFTGSISESRILVVIPKEPLGLNHLVLDLASLRSIQKEWPELEDDIVAMKELAARIELTEDYLDEILSSIIEPTLDGADWYWCGKSKLLSDSKGLNKLLSEICDQIFSATLKIRNELINRKDMSTPVVLAVKKIIRGLLMNSDQRRLGLKGNGPEISIINSVLEEYGLYRQQSDGTWHLDKPKKGQSTNIYAVWSEIEQFLQSSNTAAKSFDKLYTTLLSPPYGLRRGLISLIIWIALIYYRSTISLYESGTYIKDWEIETFVRFDRSPSLFSVRRLLLSNIGAELLHKLNAKIPNASHLNEIDGGVPLNGFLGNLYGWYSTLPEYTKQTSLLSQEAKGFMNILLTVTDPVGFILDRIPEILGLDSLRLVMESDSEDYQRKHIKKYIRKYGAVINEIDSTYPVLIKELISFMANGLGCRPVFNYLKQMFQTIDSEIIKHVLDVDARAFMIRAQQKHLAKIPWIESVTSVLSGQAPKYWEDHHIEEYKNRFSVALIALYEARKSYYARTTLDGKQQRQMKRITIEEEGKLVLENYFLTKEIDGDIDKASHEVIRVINEQYSGLSQRAKQMLLVRVLELLNSGNKNG